MPDDKGKSGMVLAVILTIIAVAIFIWLFMKKAVAEPPILPPPPPPEPECVIEADCPPGEICDNGVCISEAPPPPLPPEAECVIDADCPPGEICENGVCVPLQDISLQIILNTSDGSPIGDRRAHWQIGGNQESVPIAINAGFINESEVIRNYNPPPGIVSINKRFQGDPYIPERDPTAPITVILVQEVQWDRTLPITVIVTYP